MPRPNPRRAEEPTETLRFALALLALAGCAAPEVARPSDPTPRIEYRVRYDPSARDPRWEIDVLATGLDPANRSLVLELENWGEWTSVDSYYLRGLASEPPLRRDPEHRTRFVPEFPATWEGTLHVAYSIAPTELGSPTQGEHGLLPYRALSYSFGFSANTLMRVAGDGVPDEIECEILFDIPSDWTVASGFGVARGPSRFAAPTSVGNTVISFGRPLGQAADDDPAPGIEIVQWGGERDVTPALLAFARDYLREVIASLGEPPTGRLRLIVSEPGFGGTRVDGAIAIGCPAGLALDAAGKPKGADPYTLHFLAHEIFHDWLGGRLRPAEAGERLAWFWEGFTEYVSLYMLARAELVSRDWFAQRLLEHESVLRGNEHWGKVAFADPEVSWRDESIEPIAYSGSALVAFATDVALRRAGRSGLLEMLRDFLAVPGGRYDRETIREWLETHDVAQLWASRYAAPASSNVAAELDEIGFETTQRDVPLTYLGVELDRSGPFGHIVAVDADGPAAGLLFVGDVVGGLTPTRSDRPQISPALDTSFRFGLEWYDLSAEQVRVDVERADGHHEIWIRPRIIEGGRALGYSASGARVDEFFR